MSPQTLVSRTIIRGRRGGGGGGGGGDSAFPEGTRRVVGVTLLINVALLAIRTGMLLRRIDGHARYHTIYGSSVPGTSWMAAIVMQYGVAIVMLIALGALLWRDDGRGAAIVYTIAAFAAIPFVFARYLGREMANYSVSLSLHVGIALWLAGCGVIAVVYLRRLSRWGRGSDGMVVMRTIETTGDFSSSK